MYLSYTCYMLYKLSASLLFIRFTSIALQDLFSYTDQRAPRTGHLGLRFKQAGQLHAQGTSQPAAWTYFMKNILLRKIYLAVIVTWQIYFRLDSFLFVHCSGSSGIWPLDVWQSLAVVSSAVDQASPADFWALYNIVILTYWLTSVSE